MDFSESIKSIFKSSKSAIEKNNGTILLSHFGEMKPDVISEISEKTESKLFELKAAKKNIKRIFNILIEGLQNIKNHGDHSLDKTQFAFFQLSDYPEFFTCSFSNLINNINVKELVEDINHINTLDKVELKSLYLKKLDNGQISKKGGAGLGLIIIAMKSKNKIACESFKVNREFSMVLLNVRINKI
jgi:hypothetical protein